MIEGGLVCRYKLHLVFLSVFLGSIVLAAFVKPVYATQIIGKGFSIGCNPKSEYLKTGKSCLNNGCTSYMLGSQEPERIRLSLILESGARFNYSAYQKEYYQFYFQEYDNKGNNLTDFVSAMQEFCKEDLNPARETVLQWVNSWNTNTSESVPRNFEVIPHLPTQISELEKENSDCLTGYGFNTYKTFGEMMIVYTRSRTDDELVSCGMTPNSAYKNMGLTPSQILRSGVILFGILGLAGGTVLFIKRRRHTENPQSGSVFREINRMTLGHVVIFLLPPVVISLAFVISLSFAGGFGLYSIIYGVSQGFSLFWSFFSIFAYVFLIGGDISQSPNPIILLVNNLVFVYLWYAVSGVFVVVGSKFLEKLGLGLKTIPVKLILLMGVMLLATFIAFSFYRYAIYRVNGGYGIEMESHECVNSHLVLKFNNYGFEKPATSEVQVYVDEKEVNCLWSGDFSKDKNITCASVETLNPESPGGKVHSHELKVVSPVGITSTSVLCRE